MKSEIFPFACLDRIFPRARFVCGALALVTAFTALHAQQAVPQSRRIAIFGSSVASGTGDDTGKEGYAGKLRAMLSPRGWEVLNQSRGGDSTLTAAPRFDPVGDPQPNTKYLLPVNPAYVVIGLSLGNEGIKNESTTEGRDRIFQQFQTGIRGFVDRSRANRIVPIVANCYARADFTEVEYAYTRRMNLLINSWDVPSINFLGAVDDGSGKWVKGFVHDALHPNLAGHNEMVMTIVPSLFEALEKGKPRPVKSSTTAFARVTNGGAPLAFTPAEPMHPFAVALSVRAQGEGPVLSVTGSTLSASNYALITAAQGGQGARGAAVVVQAPQLAAINNFDSRLQAGGQSVADARTALLRAALSLPASAAGMASASEGLGAAEQALASVRAEAFAALQRTADRLAPAQTQLVVAAAGRGGSLQTFGRAGGGAIEETEFASSGAFTSAIGVRNGVWSYTAANGTVVPSTARADESWHQVIVSHFTARGETLFFVDGKLAGRVAERLAPQTFRVGGATVAAGAVAGPVDLRDLMIYRSALNEDEVAAIQGGILFQSSLEIYAPLADPRFDAGVTVENRAQSMTFLTAGPGIVHMER